MVDYKSIKRNILGRQVGDIEFKGDDYPGALPRIRMIHTPHGPSLADESYGPLKTCRGCDLLTNTGRGSKGYCEQCFHRMQQGLSLEKTIRHKNYNKK